MPRPESPNCPDNVDTCQSAIQGIRGTLFLLAIVTDEDDAATLRADLKRSRLNEYKLQRCVAFDQGCSMLKACGFDLLFLNLDERDDIESDIDRIRQTGYRNPIVGLVSRSRLDRPEYARPNAIDEILCKEDLSPSLVEHSIRAILARHALSFERSLLESRLNLALEAGELGALTYHPKRRDFELDAISLAMLDLEPGTTERSLDEVAARIFPEDQPVFVEALDRLPLPKDSLNCQFRLASERMPLPLLELRGRVWQATASSEPSIVATLRQVPKTNEIFDRISEANEAVQEAFQAREEALQRANQKLQALATELGHAEREQSHPPSSSPIPALDPLPKELPSPTPLEDSKMEPASGSIAPDSDEREGPLTHIAEGPPAEEPKPVASSGKTDPESLVIDKQATYEEVLKSVARQKEAGPTQESFPFDFAQEPIADYSPPNPAKEGFIGAAKRLVAMTRKEHEIEASISIADQQSIELEERREILFDILRELLANVVRHSKAKLCIITLFRDEDEWVLQVEDDGVGLDDTLKSVNAPLNKIGLFQIRTQLALKGGHLDMVPASPTGLIARVRLPVSIREGARSS